jgi:membrane protein DedA with SNARE-associated domain
MVQFGVPQFLAYFLGAWLKDPAKMLRPSALIIVPILGLVAWGGSWMMWRQIEERQRDQEIRWKRIRESLLAESSVAESDR